MAKPFAIWLEPLELIAIDANRTLVVASPAQTVSWVGKRFGRLIAGCAEHAGRQLRFADEPERAALGRGRMPRGIRPGPQINLEGGVVIFIVTAQQKGGVGKTTTAGNVAVLLARDDARVLVVDTDPQFALTRQLGLEDRSLGVNLVDVLAGRAAAEDAIVAGVHQIDVIPAARELAGVEMSLVGELGRELFLRDALDPVVEDYEYVVIDTPPNLGLLTVNALVCADRVLAPVSAEDEASLHGIVELRQTIARLTERLRIHSPGLVALLTRWQRNRLAARVPRIGSSQKGSLRQRGYLRALRWSHVRRCAACPSPSASPTARRRSHTAYSPSSSRK